MLVMRWDIGFGRWGLAKGGREELISTLMSVRIRETDVDGAKVYLLIEAGYQGRHKAEQKKEDCSITKTGLTR